ncbi:unnamed protein product [Prorocentrum cordatum]|uniref:Uncharacterized protein n=1 Tax=Prorocentrum cordatum TaxID=2364126 RepID=A0ABN9P8E1_9DINO|nr:unnamed protein product [Polarella glacialis]
MDLQDGGVAAEDGGEAAGEDTADTCAGPPSRKLLEAAVDAAWAKQSCEHFAEQSPVPSFASSVPPLAEHSAPFTGEEPVDLGPHVSGPLGGAFSFMCTLRMDSLESWSRVFDFSVAADEDSITAGAIELTRNLHFTVFRGRKPISVAVENFFELGRELTMLCTVSPSGHMRVFKDGALVGENIEGMAPLELARPHMVVGGHFLFQNQAFRGSLKDVKVWGQELPWPAPQEEEAPAPGAAAEGAAPEPGEGAAAAGEGGAVAESDGAEDSAPPPELEQPPASPEALAGTPAAAAEEAAAQGDGQVPPPTDTEEVPAS